MKVTNSVSEIKFYCNHNLSEVDINALSPFLETIFLSFVKVVSFGAAEVDNLGASIPIFLQLRALLAVVGIRDADTTTDHTPALQRPVVAFITNPYQRAGTHM